MKRTFLLIVFSILVLGLSFAQSISESTVTVTEKTKTQWANTVDLSTGKSSSDLVSASFNGDGNLELTYKGKDPIEIALSGKLDGTLIVKSDNADYTLILDGASISGKTLPAVQRPCRIPRSSAGSGRSLFPCRSHRSPERRKSSPSRRKPAPGT